MGTDTNTSYVTEFYKYQDDEVKSFLQEKYSEAANPDYWHNKWSFWSGYEVSEDGNSAAINKSYLKSLVRRRFGFKLETSPSSALNAEFYSANSTFVLSRSGEESLLPRNWREMYDLFFFITTESDYAIKEELVENYIKPLLEQWVDSRAFYSIQNRRDGFVDNSRAGEVVRLTSKWIRSSASTERMIKNIEGLSKALSEASGGSLIPIDDRWPNDGFLTPMSVTVPETSSVILWEIFWIELIEGYDQAFAKNSSAKNSANPAEALGFINELIAAGFDKDADSNTVEDAIRVDNSKLNEALNNLRDRITYSETQRSLKDEDDILNMRQCFLMSQKNFALPGGALAPEWANDNVNLTDWFAGTSGIKRIYRTQESKYLLNRLIGTKKSQGRWYTDCHTKLTMNKKLYWVFTDSTGELRQEELFLTQDRLVENYWDNAFGSEFQEETKNLSEEQKRKAALEEQKKFGAWNSVENLRKGHYYLKGVNIIYEGTNPSTARKDVQVEMEFQISSLASLELPISNKIVLDQETGEGYHVKLFNLITLPVTNKIGTRKGLGTVNVAAYDPDYSRVRLVVYENESDITSLSIDLSTIDHSISRDSSTGACTLKINYRGYFEQVLTMPFTDVLADKRKRDKRRAIDAQMEIIKNGNECSAKALRKAKQIEFDFYKDNTANIKSSRFIQELYDRGLIYEYEFAADPLITSWNLNENPDPSKIIRNFSKSNINGSLKGPLFDENGQLIDNVTDEIYKKYVNKRGTGRKTSWYWDFNDWWNSKEYQGEEVYKGSCFFLGDLFNLALDTIYEDEETRKKLKLQFLFGSIDTTNAFSTKNETQNPLDFAVDVVVFMKWFEQRVVAKKIAFYPLTTFFRDMLQTLLVDLKTRFCAIDNEEPPMYRMAFINTTTMYDLDPFDDDVDVGNPFGFGPTTGPIFERSPIQTDEDTRNYCVFYQQTESRFQTVKYNDREHTPRIFYGIKNNRFNSVSDVSFSKTDAPHLREARYFNNNFGDLSLLSNVYNLSFSFKNMCANKDFYPGTIFEFVLLDWGPEWVDQHPITKVLIERNSETGEYEAGDYRVFGEANPHRFGTIANVTGFGGYYIATKVDYVLGETNRDFEIKVEAKFIGANESLLMRKGEMDKNVGQPDSVKTEEQCLEELRKIAGVPKKKDDDKAANVATPGG